LASNDSASQQDPVARSYAEALLGLADQEGQLESIAEEMQDLGSLWREHPELQKLLSAPVLSSEKRGASLKRILEGRCSDLLSRFLDVVIRKDRLDCLGAICEAFRALYDERYGIVRGEIHLPREPPEAERARLAERVGEALGRKVELTAKADPSLIGGMRLRIGDEVIDGSVVRQLQRMRTQLSRAGRARASTLSTLQE
jgi:F-type H+-transporting ATPase subunit delta